MVGKISIVTAARDLGVPVATKALPHTFGYNSLQLLGGFFEKIQRLLCQFRCTRFDAYGQDFYFMQSNSTLNAS